MDVNCDTHIKNEISFTVNLFWEQCILNVTVLQKIPLKNLLQTFQSTKINFLIKFQFVNSENIHNNSSEIKIRCWSESFLYILSPPPPFYHLACLVNSTKKHLTSLQWLNTLYLLMKVVKVRCLFKNFWDHHNCAAYCCSICPVK